MRRLCLAVLWPALLACDDGGGEAEADAAVPSDFRATWPRLRACRQSIEHELEYVELYVSPAHADTYARCVAPELGCAEPLPVGTVVAKAQYIDAECRDLVRLTVSARRSAEAEDWTWLETDPDGRPRATDAASCVACHRGCDPVFDLRCVMDP